MFSRLRHHARSTNGDRRNPTTEEEEIHKRNLETKTFGNSSLKFSNIHTARQLPTRP